MVADPSGSALAALGGSLLFPGAWNSLHLQAPENHLVTQQEGSWPCGLWPTAAPALRASPTAGLHPFVCSLGTYDRPAPRVRGG